MHPGDPIMKYDVIIVVVQEQYLSLKSVSVHKIHVFVFINNSTLTSIVQSEKFLP